MNISSNEIHLWYSYDEKIHDAQLLSRYILLLNEKEREKQKRLCFEKDRHQYLVTRAMVRSVLSLYVDDIPPEKWKFAKNKYGKPFICNTTLRIPISFNISHCEKLVIMAVTLGKEVGVDVEYLLRPGDTLSMAKRYFSQEEVRQLNALPVENQKERFFDLWTLGEAYLKACGVGLSVPQDHFSYTFPRAGEIEISFTPQRNDQPQYWHFWQILPNDIHKVGMALKSDKINDHFAIAMHAIIPLSYISKVDYPIVMKTAPRYKEDQHSIPSTSDLFIARPIFSS